MGKTLKKTAPFVLIELTTEIYEFTQTPSKLLLLLRFFLRIQYIAQSERIRSWFWCFFFLGWCFEDFFFAQYDPAQPCIDLPDRDLDILAQIIQVLRFLPRLAR
jgi:hypothetical protein